MKGSSWPLLGLIAFGASPAPAAPQCSGVFGYAAVENGFECRYRHGQLHRARATCHDGEPGCDADGRCDGACRFALCADPACSQGIEVSVPLGRDGRARRTIRFGGRKTRLRLGCLPARSPCGTPESTTTSSTTSTTLGPHACFGTLGGAVSATFTCTAALSVGGLGLPALTLDIEARGLHGSAAALLASSVPGSFRLGGGIMLTVVALDRAGLPRFQGTRRADRESAEVRIASVVPSPVVGVSEVHGSLDATLPGVSAPASLRLQAEF